MRGADPGHGRNAWEACDRNAPSAPVACRTRRPVATADTFRGLRVAPGIYRSGRPGQTQVTVGATSVATNDAASFGGYATGRG